MDITPWKDYILAGSNLFGNKFTYTHTHTHRGSNEIKHIIKGEAAMRKSSILAKYRRKAVKLKTNHNNRKDFLAVGW